MQGNNTINKILTVNIAHNRMGKSMAGEGHKHFSSTFPPDSIMCWTPTRYCTK